MPLVTLMEREAVTFEGTDMWEKNDESCEIMLNHLATARLMAEAADSYRMNAESILAGKSWFWLSCSLHSNWNEGMKRASMLSIRKRPNRKD